MLHLRDLPVHGVDVRTVALQIRLPSENQVSTALRHWVTKLYRGEHTGSTAAATR